MSLAIDAAQRRALLRQTIIARGPDVARQVGRLKLRGVSPGAAQVLELAERGALAVPEAGQIAGVDGVVFITCWSVVGGEDVVL